MFRLKQKAQLSELSKSVYEKIVRSDDDFAILHDQIDFSFVNELCKPFYGKTGKPNDYTPEQLYRGALVEYVWELSDRKLERTITNDIVAKWFVGLEITDTSFDHSTISRFRDRLGPDKFKELFNQLLEQIVQKNFIKKDDMLLVDATHSLANIALPSFFRLVKHAAQKVWKTLNKIDPSSLARVEQDYFKFIRHDESKPTKQSQPYINKVIFAARKLLGIAEQKLADQNFENYWREQLEKNTALLKRVLEENVRIIKDENGEENCEEINEKPKDRLLSVVDTEAKVGATTSQKRFVGYRAHIHMTEKGYITNVVGTIAPVNEQKYLLPMFDEEQAKHDLHPAKVIADAMYGAAGANRQGIKDRGSFLVSPLKSGPRGQASPQDVFDKTNFVLLEEHDVVICPVGNSINRLHEGIDGGKTFVFPNRYCMPCPLKQLCGVKRHNTTEGKTFHVNQHYRAYEEALYYNDTESYKEEIHCKRQAVESKIAELKRFRGLKHCRYKGLNKYNVQLSMGATACNLLKFARDYRANFKVAG